MRTNDPFIHNYLKERQKKFVTLYAEGKTYREIAEQFGISIVTVHRNLTGKVKAIE